MLRTRWHHNPCPAHNVYVQILTSHRSILNAHMWLRWFLKMPKSISIWSTQRSFRWFQMKDFQILLWIANIIVGGSCRMVRIVWEAVVVSREFGVVVEKLFVRVLVCGGGRRHRMRWVGVLGRWGCKCDNVWRGTWRHGWLRHCKIDFVVFTEYTRNRSGWDWPNGKPNKHKTRKHEILDAQHIEQRSSSAQTK